MPWPKGKPRGPQSPEHIAARMAAGAHASRGVPQSQEHVEKCRQLRVGKKLAVTPARAAAVSKSWERGVYDKNARKTFSYKGVYMRSSWEVLAAEAFDDHGIKWVYEPQRFRVASGTYLPDFYLPELDHYVEVKGYLSDSALAKFTEFSATRAATMIRADATDEFAELLGAFVLNQRVHLMNPTTNYVEVDSNG